MVYIRPRDRPVVSAAGATRVGQLPSGGTSPSHTALPFHWYSALFAAFPMACIPSTQASGAKRDGQMSSKPGQQTAKRRPMRRTLATVWGALLLLPAPLTMAIAAEIQSLEITRLAPRIERVRFQSSILEETKHFVAVLPKDFDRQAEGHPFLVFLHGRGRNPQSLLEHPASREAVLGAGFVTIFPQGDVAWYIDSPVNSKARYASYLEEVIRLATNQYGLSKKPERRALAGWSMGGYGCVRFAQTHPGQFAAASPIVGLLDYPRSPDDFPPGQRYPVRTEYFGADPAAWKTLNPMTSADRLAGTSILLVTADEAFDRTMNERFSRRLDHLGIATRLEVLKGSHSMAVVHQAVPLVIAHTQAAFRRQVPGRSDKTSSPRDATSQLPGPPPVYLNWDANCLALGPAGIAELVLDARQAGVQGINLRVSNKGALAFRTRAGTCYSERLDAFGADFDPLAVLIAECHKQGIAAHVWVDLFEAAYDPLIMAHPEFSPQGRPGKPRLAGVPCYAHAEVRDHMLELVDEYAAYRPDGVFFCTKSSHVPRNQLNQPHNRDSGFNPPVVRRYRELYGVDILKEPFDREKLGRVRGEFLIDFLVEARRRLNRAGIRVIVGATTSGRLQPLGPNFHLDWRRLLERRAADALLMSNTRGEYHVFYNAPGRAAFAEIRQACDTAGVRFWPYIIVSGTYQPIADRVGYAGLLQYVPRQLDYLTALGGDAVLLQDPDLYAFDRNLRRALWKAMGRRQSGVARTESPRDLPAPDPASIFRARKETVPCGHFEQDADAFWFLQSAWTLVPGTPLATASFEGRTADSRPIGWSPDNGRNPRLKTVFDWAVMHGDPFSGRAFSGRCSLALGASPGAADGARSAAWTAEVPVPRHLRGDQRIRVHAHGESLRHIDSVGMTVDCLDSDENVLAQLDAAAPREGTYPWRPIETVWAADSRVTKLRVRLALTAADHPGTEGRVWFDELSIAPAQPLAADALTFPAGSDRDPAYRGRMARWDARPGWNLVSIPFLVPKTNDENARPTFRVALRAQPPARVTLAWQPCGHTDKALVDVNSTPREEHETTFAVTPSWQIFSMPAAPGHGRIVLRPHGATTLWLDEFTTLPSPFGRGVGGEGPRKNKFDNRVARP